MQKYLQNEMGSHGISGVDVGTLGCSFFWENILKNEFLQPIAFHNTRLP